MARTKIFVPRETTAVSVGADEVALEIARVAKKTGAEIVAFLLECHAQWGMGMIISSHDSYVAQNMDTVYQVHDGALHTK